MSRYTGTGRGPGLTIVALAWQEGEHLRKCFASVKLLVEMTGAQTLVVLDAEADALTAQLAREVAQRVRVAKFDSFAAQRNRALSLAETDWVFFIDADERMTPELAREVAQVLLEGSSAAYRVPRRNILFRHEVRHTGWWPDYQVRLLKRTSSKYNEARPVHEVPEVGGSIGTLKEPLVHFNYDNWQQFVSKQLYYAPLEAQLLFAEGMRARRRSFLGQPLREFKRRFIDYRGYRDGLLGLELSAAMSVYKVLVYWHLRRLGRPSG